MKLRPRKQINYAEDLTAWVDEYIHDTRPLKKQCIQPFPVYEIDQVSIINILDLPIELLRIIIAFCDEETLSQFMYVCREVFCLVLDTEIPTIDNQNEKRISRLRLLYGSRNPCLSILHSYKMQSVMKRNSVSRILYLKTYKWKHIVNQNEAFVQWLNALFEQYLSKKYCWMPLHQLSIDFKNATHSVMPFIFYNVDTLILLNIGYMQISRDRVSKLVTSEFNLKRVIFKNGFQYHHNAISILRLMQCLTLQEVYIECSPLLSSDIQVLGINEIVRAIDTIEEEVESKVHVYIMGKLESSIHSLSFPVESRTIIHLQVEFI